MMNMRFPFLAGMWALACLMDVSAAQATPCSPRDLPETGSCLGLECSTLGASTMDANKQNIVVCLRNSSGDLMWKNMSNASATESTVVWIEVAGGTVQYGGDDHTWLRHTMNPMQLCQAVGYTTYTGACSGLKGYDSTLRCHGSIRSSQSSTGAGLDCAYGSQVSQGTGRSLQLLCSK